MCPLDQPAIEIRSQIHRPALWPGIRVKMQSAELAEACWHARKVGWAADAVKRSKRLRSLALCSDPIPGSIFTPAKFQKDCLHSWSRGDFGAKYSDSFGIVKQNKFVLLSNATINLTKIGLICYGKPWSQIYTIEDRAGDRVRGNLLNASYSSNKMLWHRYHSIVSHISINILM